jgi:S1-C subfamily serine protease
LADDSATSVLISVHLWKDSFITILLVTVWILTLPALSPAQSTRRKARKAPPPSVVAPSPEDEIVSSPLTLRSQEPKGLVWVSQTVDLARQLGGVDNIMTLDGEPPPSFVKKRTTLGLVVDDQGHIVTRLFEASPTEPPSNVRVYASNGRPVAAKFLGMDAVTGFCVLKAEDAAYEPATIAEPSALPNRLAIRLYGFHPNLNQNAVPGLSLDRPRRNFYLGQIAKAVSDFRFLQNNPIYYLLSPKLTPAQDCSLILDKDDSVFGVAIYDIGSEGLNLVYPIARIKSIADAIIKTHKSLSYGWLGVGGVDSSPSLQTPLSRKIAPELGVRVTAVHPDSPADLAGVRPKDILLGVNDRRIETYAQFIGALQQFPPESEISLRAKRGNEYKTFKVRLIAAPSTEPEEQLLEFRSRLEQMEGKLESLPPADPGRETLAPKVTMMRTFLDQVKSPAPPDIRLRVFYGFEIQPLSTQLMSYFGATNGVLVTSVVEKYKADKAGLKAGDVIVSIGDKPVSNLNTLITALDAASSQPVDITFYRRRSLSKIVFSH